MKKFLANLFDWLMAFTAIIGALFLTAFMFWPFIALILIACVLFWIFLPIIGWIIFIVMMIFIVAYVLIGIFENN